MDDKVGLNDSVYSTQNNSINVTNEYSNIIKYTHFTASAVGAALWTPTEGKSIYLTAISVSATFALSSITFSSTSINPFLILQLTTTLETYNASYTNPVVFNPGDTISVSFSGTGLNVDITLYGFEK